MCRKCDVLTAALLLDEAQADLISAETAAGLAPTNAARPLTINEHRSQARFATLESELDRAVAAATIPVEDLHAVVRAAVLTALFGKNAVTIKPAAAVAMIEEMMTTRPAVVKSAVDAAVETLTAIFAGSYESGTAAVIGEAARQGVTAPPAAPTVSTEAMAIQAAAVAAHPWQRVIGKVRDELGKPAVLMGETITIEEVTGILEGIKIDGTRDLARQAINTATGMGRNDTADQLEPDEIWASEIMDGIVCDHCAAVDGKDYSSMAEARADYPFGTYKDCAGAARCRGTLVFVFKDEPTE